jgi:hypothetical protein
VVPRAILGVNNRGFEGDMAIKKNSYVFIGLFSDFIPFVLGSAIISETTGL